MNDYSFGGKYRVVETSGDWKVQRRFWRFWVTIRSEPDEYWAWFRVARIEEATRPKRISSTPCDSIAESLDTHFAEYMETRK